MQMFAYAIILSAGYSTQQTCAVCRRPHVWRDDGDLPRAEDKAVLALCGAGHGASLLGTLLCHSFGVVGILVRGQLVPKYEMVRLYW